MTEIIKDNFKMIRFWVIKALQKIHGSGDYFIMDESTFTEAVRGWMTYNIIEAKKFKDYTDAEDYLKKFVIAVNNEDASFWEITEVLQAGILQKIEYKPMQKTPQQMAFLIYSECKKGIFTHPDGWRAEDKQALNTSLVVVSFTSTHDLGNDHQRFWSEVKDQLQYWLDYPQAVISDKI